MPTAAPRTTEGKYRTDESTKQKAAEIYAHWGLSLSDAINIFLVKSVDIGGLPFSITPGMPPYEALAERAYKAPLDEQGIPTLPADWDDGDE